MSKNSFTFKNIDHEFMTNVVLKDTRKVVEVTLPSFPESKIAVYQDLLFGDMKELEKATTDSERGLVSMRLLIKDWNFTNEKGEKLLVTEENLEKLPVKDLTVLLEKARKTFEIASSKKKTT